MYIVQVHTRLASETKQHNSSLVVVLQCAAALNVRTSHRGRYGTSLLHTSNYTYNPCENNVHKMDVCKEFCKFRLQIHVFFPLTGFLLVLFGSN